MNNAPHSIVRLINQDRANGHERLAQMRESIWQKLQSSGNLSLDHGVVAGAIVPSVERASMLTTAIAMLKGMLRRYGVEFFIYDSFATAHGKLEVTLVDMFERAVQAALNNDDVKQLCAMVYAEQLVGIVVPDKVKLPFPIPLGGEAVGGAGSMRQMLMMQVGSGSEVGVVEGCDIRSAEAQSLLHGRYIQLINLATCRWQSFRKSRSSSAMSFFYSVQLDNESAFSMVSAHIAGKCVDSGVKVDGHSAQFSYLGTSIVEGCQAPSVKVDASIKCDSRFFERTHDADLAWDDVFAKNFSGKIAVEYFVELESRRVEGLCFRESKL